MNPQLIQKLIKFNNEHVPEFTYTNPLLDRNVTKALSKSFLKILTSDQNTNVSNNLRLSILENIRKMCMNEPEDHVTMSEDHKELVIDFYKKHVFDICNTDSMEKELDAFLIRNFKELNIDSSCTVNINPEIIQALINLSSDVNEKLFIDNLIHWDTNTKASNELINNLWKQTTNGLLVNDIVIKIKPVIEKLLIETCLRSLEDENYDIKTELLNEQYIRLFRTCAISPYCFEICIYILNLLFISTNFSCKLLQLIECFIGNVKSSCSEAISSLYPVHLSHIVTFLDVNLTEFPEDIRKNYIVVALKYLSALQNECESDYILLLSHFPQWFELSV